MHPVTTYQATIAVDHGVSLGMGSNYPELSDIVTTFEIPAGERAEHGIGDERFMASVGIYGALRKEVKDIVEKEYLSNPDTGLVTIALKELCEGGRTVLPTRDDMLRSRVMLRYSPLLQFLTRTKNE